MYVRAHACILLVIISLMLIMSSLLVLSQLGKPYGLHNLLSDCKMGIMSEDVLKAVWFALSQYINEKINCEQPKVIMIEFSDFNPIHTSSPIAAIDFMYFTSPRVSLSRIMGHSRSTRLDIIFGGLLLNSKRISAASNLPGHHRLGPVHPVDA